MIRAEINYTTNNKKLLYAINKALSPDNKKTPPHMVIKNKVQNNTLTIILLIEGYDNKIGTLLNTLDEILALMKSVEKTIMVVNKDCE